MVDENFDHQESLASLTYPSTLGNLKKGDNCIIHERPCKVVDIMSFKNGKHGHAKTHIVGIDIFTSKKHEDVLPQSHNVEIPVIKKREYPLQYMDEDGYVTMMLENGSTRSDLKVTDETIRAKIENHMKAKKDLLVISVEACGEEHIVELKEC